MSLVWPFSWNLFSSTFPWHSVLFVFHYFTMWNVEILVNFNLNTLKVNACSVQYYNVPWRWRGIVSPLRFAAPSRNPGAMYFPVLDAADGSAVPAAAPKNRTTANLDSKQTKSKLLTLAFRANLALFLKWSHFGRQSQETHKTKCPSTLSEVGFNVTSNMPISYASLQHRRF